MGQRLELQSLLKTILGSEHVYYQPPNNTQLTYDCIVYELDDAETLFADNKPYRYTKQYQVTLITRDPDNPIQDEIAKLPMCAFDRSFRADNLYHFVFNIFF